MQSNKSKKFVSIEEIRGMYLKTRDTDFKQDSDNNLTKNNVLTASAKHVVREAKKVIGTLSTPEKRINAPSEEQLEDLIKSIEKKEGEELSTRERHAALVVLTSSLDHYDILTSLIQNPEVNDIIIRSFDDISIQVGRRNIQTDVKFSDFETYKAFVESILKRAGKSCTVANPIVDAAIDPQIRACVTHESISPSGSGPMLTLRISRFQSISLEGLESFGYAAEEILSYLSGIVMLGAGSILIAGEVGTGKTTLVRALANVIDENEALLVIEDTNEINLKRKFVRTLLTRESNLEGNGRVSPAQAIRAGMRMAMNRIILGEIRDGEAAEAFVDVCASGHPGMSTIHAKSGRDALSRLELFLARAQGDVGIDTIRRQIANAISVVVYVGIDRISGSRRILTVHEVDTAYEGAVQMSPMYEFNSVLNDSSENSINDSRWIRGSGISNYHEDLKRIGFIQSVGGSRVI